MGRDTRSSFTRHWLAAPVLLALCLAGCGGNSYVQAGASGSPSTGVTSGGSVSVQGYSTFGALLAIGVLVGVSRQADRAAPPFPGYVPELDPARRVAERDCTQPIEDWSANLKCR